MKLWILKPVNAHSAPWMPWYDKAFGFVVRAETELEAREFAADKAGDEKPSAWLLSEWSTCEEITYEGEPGMILQDFAAA